MVQGFSRSATHILGVASGILFRHAHSVAGGTRVRRARPQGHTARGHCERGLGEGESRRRKSRRTQRDQLRLGEPRNRKQMEIVGLARNAKYDDLTGDFPAIVYLPFEQNPNMPADEMTFFLRTAGNPLGVCGRGSRDRAPGRRADSGGGVEHADGTD